MYSIASSWRSATWAPWCNPGRTRRAPGERAGTAGIAVSAGPAGRAPRTMRPCTTRIRIATATTPLLSGSPPETATPPIDGDTMDLNRLARLGDEGVLVLLADSTNVERPGYTLSEQVVGETFKDVFLKAESRIIVATFASNVHRVQQIIFAAEYFNKKIAISGRSMINTVSVAVELGYLKVKKDTLIDINDINKYKPNEIVILTTGSQGEPMKIGRAHV